MTKLPVTVNPDMEMEDFSVIITYFPIVGLILGGIFSIVTWVNTRIFDPLLCSIFAVLISVVLTGGLHIDGLGDSFDALFSYRNRERMLEIMKDSRIGTNGILAIFFVLLLKIGLLHRYMEQGSEMFEVLLTMPVIGRFSLVLSCYRGVYARKDGMGSPFIGKVSNTTFFKTWIQTLSVLLLIPIVVSDFYLLGKYLFAFIFSCFFVILANHFVTSKIGGLTGDTLGAVCELTELAYLMFFYLGGSLTWIFI